MKDFLGNELNAGDAVAFVNPDWDIHQLQKGIVLGIFDDLAEVCYQMNYRTYNYQTKEFDIDNLQEHTRKVDYMRLIKI